MPNDSILNTTKKFLGLVEEDDAFDMDVMLHINSVFSTLQQLGVGPALGFSIDDETATWNDYIANNKAINMVRSYMYLRVRVLFDPPTTSYTLDAFNNQIKEAEWRLNIAVDTGMLVSNPSVPIVIPPELIEAAVDAYLDENPITADEPLLEEHLLDPTPHPPYDDLVDGRFTTRLQNGMA